MPTDKVISYVPRNEAQREAEQAYQECDVLFLIGPAGSGKTHAAVAPALRDIFNKKIDKLFLSRPQIEVGEATGFLPGDLNAKMRPWIAPIMDVMGCMTFKNPEDILKAHVEIVPLGFMRGRTFSRSVTILDEAQNCTMKQLKMFLTRLGHRGKLIVSGDPTQSDLRPTVPGYSCDLEAMAESLLDLEVEGAKVGIVDFTEDDIVRNPLIAGMLKRWRIFKI